MPKGSIESMSIEYTKYIQIPTNKNYNRKKKKKQKCTVSIPFSLSFLIGWIFFFEWWLVGPHLFQTTQRLPNCRPESIQTPSLVGQHASRRPHAFGRSLKWFVPGWRTTGERPRGEMVPIHAPYLSIFQTRCIAHHYCLCTTIIISPSFMPLCIYIYISLSNTYIQ